MTTPMLEYLRKISDMDISSIPRSVTSIPMVEILKDLKPEMERNQLIHVATAIHSAVILSPKAKGDIKESVAEAVALIEMCDKFLGR